MRTFTYLRLFAPWFQAWLLRAIVPRRRFSIVGRGVIVVWLGVSSVAMASAPETTAEDEQSQSAATTKAPSKFRSAEDGWLDLSAFIDQAYGFAPLVVPITEPAIGYGAAGGLAFIDKPQDEAQAGFGRPNITAVGGLATDNDTWGAMAGDSRYWLDSRLQTLVGGVYASVNLDFYGVGEDRRLKSDPLSYNIEPLAGFVQAKYRLGDSRVWGGLGYTLATVQVEFDAPAATPGLPDFHDESQVGGLMPSLTYDSRDTIFTPTRGTYVDTTAGLFSEALGGDDEFQRVSLVGIHYLPLRPTLTLGIRGDGMMSFGDVPFYLRPFIFMRGVSAMRYQGEHVAQAEAELRWQFWKRFSLVGFVGGGAAWSDLERFDETQTVLTGGTGFRYELARKYGLHVGVDVAFGPDEPIVYVQFGSAWMRP
jgi:outer membrane protein assembly factor BamA